MRRTRVRVPLGLLIATNAMKQKYHGILLVFGIAGRSIDLHPALKIWGHSRGIIIHLLELAVFNVRPHPVKACGCREHRLYVIRSKCGSTATTTTTTPSAAPSAAAARAER